jgi:hypothetical protein
MLWQIIQQIRRSAEIFHTTFERVVRAVQSLADECGKYFISQTLSRNFSQIGAEHRLLVNASGFDETLG